MVRVDVDPTARLESTPLREAMVSLHAKAAAIGAEVVDVDLAALPPSRRQVEILIAGDDADRLKATALRLCDDSFGVLGATPAAGVLTYVSRGTDDDAHGVLEGLGLRGEVDRTHDARGWDVVTVTLPTDAMARVPESRVQTALEASLNCEVHIVTR